jgi:hypothetical protein
MRGSILWQSPSCLTISFPFLVTSRGIYLNTHLAIQSMLGRDGFRGADAENALKELKEVLPFPL